MRKNITYKLAQVGLLIALEIVLSRFLSINTQILKIGLNFIPVVVVAMLYGPLWAGAAAALGDLLGALLFPIGPYFPGFTATALLSGVVYGLLLHRPRLPKVAASALAAGIVGLPLHLGLNTLWLHILYGKGYLVLLPPRIFQCLVTMVAQFLVIWLILGRIGDIKRYSTS